MDFKMTVVVDEAQLAKLVHKMAHPRPGRADHLGKSFLTYLRDSRLRPAFLSEMASSNNSLASRFSVELNN